MQAVENVFWFSMACARAGQYRPRCPSGKGLVENNLEIDNDEKLNYSSFVVL